LALLAPAIIVYAGPARAQIVQPAKAVPTSYYEGSDGNGRFLPVADTKPAAPDAAAAPAANGSCGCATGGCTSGCGNNCCDCDVWEGCDDCPTHSLILFSGFESWRGFADGSYPNNNGAVVGFNYGTAVSQDYGIGFQFGGSYGVFDWNGRDTTTFSDAGDIKATQAQEQVFITTGFFKKADECSRWSAGIVYDFSLNQNFGIYANSPYLTQWRGQFSYATSSHNEFGVWGTLRDHGFTQNTPYSFTGDPVSFRAVNQTNLFWHHKFDQGADSYIWVGVPDFQSKLGDLGGSLGDYIVGGMVTAPISDYLALYSNVQYMHPSAHPGVDASMEETWDIGFGLAWYPGGNARTKTVSGSCFSPLLNVANNGSFMVDSSQHE